MLILIKFPDLTFRQPILRGCDAIEGQQAVAERHRSLATILESVIDIERDGFGLGQLGHRGAIFRFFAKALFVRGTAQTPADFVRIPNSEVSPTCG